jgi:hypothetical protein
MVIPGYAQQRYHTATPSAPDQGDAPTVETGLPKARTAPKPPVPQVEGDVPQRAHTVPAPNYSNSTVQPRRRTITYPWKANIITTVFWIGEGGSTISSTTNVDSAWITNWSNSYGGDDDLERRRGLLPRDHAALCNPFYIALPFNDLAFPDKAARWLPAGWSRPVRPGQKQISACKDRWVEIRNSQGRSCFAQWEDVGPLRFDHAEYVFGDERPNTYTRAGLDVSPAVATYLGIDENNRITSWRFVEAEDVPPGDWLKYEEQATLLLAMREMKDPIILPPLPGQPATTTQPQTPVDDPSQKKKVHNPNPKG